MRCRRPAVALLAVSILATGCATSFGARIVGPARFDYAEAVGRSWNEQLLLNLVRLRYRDTPVFLEVGPVVTQYTWSGDAGLAASLVPGGDDELGGSLGGGYRESPTITYDPLQGQDFVRRLLTPVSPYLLLLLSQSGWSIERLLTCCVQRVGELTNAPSATGPTPEAAPDNARFRELASRLRRLQVAGLFDLRSPGSGEGVRVLLPGAAGGSEAQEEDAAVRRLLGLPEDAAELDLVEGTDARLHGKLAIQGRSVLGTLFFFSHTVEPPEEHLRRGWVTVTRDVAGEPVDWGEITGGLLRVRSSGALPADAFVRVRYRGHWFYLPDDDLQSKSTFTLLTLLFSLQAAEGDAKAPLLSLSAGG